MQIFIINAIFADNVDSMVQESLNQKQFTVGFDDAYSVTIKHNKGSNHFVYSIFDTVENTQLNAQLEIISENEVKVDFIDPMSGNIFMYFQ